MAQSRQQDCYGSSRRRLLSLGEGTSDFMQRQQVTIAASAGNQTAGFHTLFPLSSLEELIFLS